MIWTREEARPRIRQKRDSGDGTTWEKKKEETEAETGVAPTGSTET